MTSGELGFLVLVTAGFVGFAVVLAYYSWQQGRAERPAATAAMRPGAPAGMAADRGAGA